MSTLAVRIIPCLDFKEGRVVKGTRFQNLVDSGDPVERALAYEAQGADELTFLDISATVEGRKTMAEAVARIREVLSIPLTVGGGIRSIEDAARLLEAGADRVSVNSAAVRSPGIVDELAARFGVQCVVVAIDAAQNEAMPSGYEVKIAAGSHATGLDAVKWAREAAQRGAGEILLTSIDRDGTSRGYDCRLLRLVADTAHIPIVASGGAAKLEHFLEGYKMAHQRYSLQEFSSRRNLHSRDKRILTRPWRGGTTMIIPSIDIMKGRAVQLRGGKQPPLDAGNPLELASRYGRVGEFAVVDLDAAKGNGDNRELILSLCRTYHVRVGGGIRSIDRALEYLNAGARYIMIGTAATPEFLANLPKERLIAALDSKEGTIMVEGWSTPREGSIEASIKILAPYVAGFLITFIETEGDQCGIDIERTKSSIALAPDRKFTFAGGAAGGSRGIADIAALDRLGADLQAGTSLVVGDLSLAEAFAAPLSSDRPDGLWPTIVCDESGQSTWACLFE